MIEKQSGNQELDQLAFYFVELKKFKKSFQDTRVKDVIKKGKEMGIKEGLEKGKEEGLKKGLELTARNLLNMGAPIDQVCKGTGLSEEEVKLLKN